ncbi:MAG: hypothetical protein NZ108_05950 [Bacteroidia bacterium]|nr:hypothetical protein [Bacteroidia bacterium]
MLLVKKKILSDVIPTICPGGRLIYSTCTFAPEENIEQIEWILTQFPELTSISISVPSGIQEVRKDTAIGYQAYFHQYKGEGFFMAVFQKEGEWKSREFPQFKQEKLPFQPEKWVNCPSCFQFWKAGDYWVAGRFKERLSLVEQSIRVIRSGTAVFTQKGKELVPNPEFAFASWKQIEIPKLELTLDQVLQFIRRKPFSLAEYPESGWYLVHYQGYDLGWVKVISNRINNYFPVEFRVQQEL